jgi:hypothetical protein
MLLFWFGNKNALRRKASRGRVKTDRPLEFVPEVCLYKITSCGPDGLHNQGYNSILIIPTGIPLDEALELIKKWQNGKNNISEEPDS